VVCEDFENQRRFYRDVLGMTEIDGEEGWVWFQVGDNLFELISRSGAAEYDRPRYQVGFAVEDIHQARDELIERGVEALTEVRGGPESLQYWAYFKDQEGNVFSIIQRLRDVPRNSSQASQ
jgi:catechol 2,3-dioxygenase-like lactoylglutathione lyase family enzyme